MQYNDYYAAAARKQLVVEGAGVLANDTDADGNTLTATLVSAPKHGKLALNEDGSFVYNPNDKFRGIDSFTYKAADGGSSDVATVWIKVGAAKGAIAPTQNEVPEATGDSYSMVARTKLKVPLAESVLANDTDGDGNGLRAVLVAKSAAWRAHAESGWHFCVHPQKRNLAALIALPTRRKTVGPCQIPSL